MDHSQTFALHAGYLIHLKRAGVLEDNGQRVENHEAVFLIGFLTFSGCYCRMLKGFGDEGMLTRAPPDHQATCFNIHDITSSLGGAGLHKDEAARSRLLYWMKSHSLSQQ